MNKDLVSRLKEFMENEARSCSMDLGIRGRFLDPLFTCTLDVAQSCAKLQLAFAAYGIRGRFLDPLFTCTLDVAQSRNGGTGTCFTNNRSQQ